MDDLVEREVRELAEAILRDVEIPAPAAWDAACIAIRHLRRSAMDNLLVERLRSDYAKDDELQNPEGVIDKYRMERHEAADEIERLRCMLRAMK